ncbi:HAD superfamily hydrolase (TIGR01450 family)/HAD superfamily hydrolase (TIGR01549 family) [Sediminihabitans luteus]|uniref:HAD superfamily hydrolase (TIGR01450 family)/HAD superfamily hydrolase (TIGR01549 family) n=1 Tax=Sediminihabitans luteus TaxID=1138585 RepID=A0A2M9CRH5_9CELL|nr:HAD-IIA family hydrolase [Sediminihabitans luteus]PJJ74441.1 HAD superfamily hydrolase (TIGR01450 family)/HAD superfamily hydrolase (TIGR01549 family) [Sediminihabitans luteus]GIJ00192.1 haloacid dehalogenase [Sediminihabitans luteus]
MSAPGGTGLLACDVPLAQRYGLALVDLDGVAYRGPDPIEHASQGLVDARDAGMRLVFVTNNASREPEQVADQLTGLGIPTGPDEVMTAAQACAALLTTRLAPGARVLVVGGAGLRTAVTAAGFQVVSSADDEPEAVAQGFSPELGWTDLAEAAFAVERGAWHVASNLDLSLPQARGFAPGNGSLVAAVQAATGVVPDSAGKPSPTMYRLAVERAGATEALVIGDRLDTDLAGARSGGYPGLHVLTGVSSARDAVLAVPGERPHFLGADLRALHVAHPAPVQGPDGWWECRGQTARVSDGRLELADHPGATDVLDLARAACAAVWSAVDAGETVDADTVPELPVGSD